MPLDHETIQGKGVKPPDEQHRPHHDSNQIRSTLWACMIGMATGNVKIMIESPSMQTSIITHKILKATKIPQRGKFCARIQLLMAENTPVSKINAEKTDAAPRIRKMIALDFPASSVASRHHAI
jgi:hypothetical protein